MLNMSRVCHLTSVHSPRDPRILKKECHSLANAGYEVHLIACSDKYVDLKPVIFHSIPIPRNRLIRMTITVLRIFSQALKIKGSLYHFHDPELIIIGLLTRAHFSLICELGLPPCVCARPVSWGRCHALWDTIGSLAGVRRPHPRPLSSRAREGRSRLEHTGAGPLALSRMGKGDLGERGPLTGTRLPQQICMASTGG